MCLKQIFKFLSSSRYIVYFYLCDNQKCFRGQILACWAALIFSSPCSRMNASCECSGSYNETRLHPETLTVSLYTFALTTNYKSANTHDSNFKGDHTTNILF